MGRGTINTFKTDISACLSLNSMLKRNVDIYFRFLLYFVGDFLRRHALAKTQVKKVYLRKKCKRCSISLKRMKFFLKAEIG